MEDEVIRLKDELKTLKIKLKSKCEKLKKANDKVKELTIRRNNRFVWKHWEECQHHLLQDITKNLDQYIYEIKFSYNGKVYTEDKVPAFGSRWLRDALVIHLAKTKSLILETYELKIISAKKLW